MATPVIDLHERLRRAGMPEEQARAIADAFETLDRRLDRLEARQRLHTALLIVIAAAVLAPYVGALFAMGVRDGSEGLVLNPHQGRRRCGEACTTVRYV